MAWQIKIKKTAEKQMGSFDRNIQIRIVKAIRGIECLENPRSSGKELKGNKSKLWRYRVGDYRLICELLDKEKIINILEVGHRKEIYH